MEMGKKLGVNPLEALAISQGDKADGVMLFIQKEALAKIDERGPVEAPKSSPKSNVLTEFEELALEMEDVPGVKSDVMIKALARAKAKLAQSDLEAA